jgi:probable HAF family extracellular repeat protein
MRRWTLTLVSALLVFLPWHQTLRADAGRYTIESLGGIPGVTTLTVTGMNASGQVVGIADGMSAVRYTDESGWEFLPNLGWFSAATGINALGDVVGYHFTPAGDLRAFRYDHATGLVADIDPPAGSGSMTFGYAINNLGDVVGSVDGTRAFRARPGQTAELLPSLGGDATACGINDAGQIVGASNTAAGTPHAFLLEPGAPRPTDIGSFDGATGWSGACAIDATGRVGGQADRAGVSRAFRFQGDLLGVTPFASRSSNTESVAAGTSVGWYELADRTLRAFVHTDAGGGADLNDLVDDAAGWTLAQAKAVNAAGMIAGEGTLNGLAVVFRVKPVASAPVDTTAPVIRAVNATPARIFPPNGAMVSVAVSVNAADETDPSPVCRLSGVDGHGAPAGDASVTGPLTASVRATGGATYSLNVSCSDAAGNVSTGSVDVVVPPDTTAPVVGRVTATPARIWPPNDALVTVSVAVAATDDVDAAPVCGLSSITSSGVTADDYAIIGPFVARVRATGGRSYTLNVRCSDAAGNSGYGSTQVVVLRDTTAPVIWGISATPSAVWPPNGKFVDVSVSVRVTDNVDASPSCALTSITGAPAGDYMITGSFTASVRAEKNEDGSTRTYALQLSCGDRAGNRSSATTYVVVSKDPVARAFTSNSARK